MKEIIKDMTVGKPSKVILNFAIPLVVGNVFQQLYTFVDTMIAGKFLGINALAALGATGWLTFMMIGSVQGMAQGFSVSISHKLGEQDYVGLKKNITHSIYLSVIISVVLSIFGIILCRPILSMLNTPGNILKLSCEYLEILCIGMIVTVAYNLMAAILRALGDSSTPLKAITAASIFNVVLDILFVIVFEWGIKGAAYATLLAQFISFIYCLIVFLKDDKLRMNKNDFILDIHCCINLLKLGYPMGLQNIIIGVGGVIVQSVINSYGILFIAGFTAANKLYALLEIAASSYGYAMSTYTGQNVGAGNIDRIKNGIKDASILGIVTAYAMSLIMLIFGKIILGCFVTGENVSINEIIEIGYTFLKILSVFFPLLYLLYIISSCIQGMGNTFLPMLSSTAQLATRILCAVILTRFIGQNGVFWGEILAWVAADIILIISYFFELKKLIAKNNFKLINNVY